MKRSSMPPRKRPMNRGSKPPLKRSELRRKKTMQRAAEKRRYETGPTDEVKARVVVRSRGRCEVCGTYLDGPWSMHHRQPRGMGGSNHCDWINEASNLLLVCGSATTPDGCHQLIESQRTLAYANGWLVHRPERPAEIPVELHDGLVYLDDDGNYVKGSP